MRFLRKKVPRHHHDMWKIKLEIRFASVKIGKIFFSVFGIDFFNGGGRDQKIKIFSVVIRLDF